MPFFQTFSLKFKKIRGSTTGGETTSFEIEDAAHSGTRNMAMPSPIAEGTFVYSTTESAPNNADSQAFEHSGHDQPQAARRQQAFVAPARPEAAPRRLGYRIAFWVNPQNGQQRVADLTETV
ncbi:hypothetical protein BKA70DRAFT_1569641 [Coprinopsis sp. MPI-PUGE-AT-0042]|nr:hypothetical protein BKA70DRAFT_1569641 [Coprinopsis sp. MPI-PUGE-AT-0042]